MASDQDMAGYVTRGELREELKTFGEQLEQRIEEKLEQKLAPYAKKADLDAVCTILLMRMEQIERGQQSLGTRLDLVLARQEGEIRQYVRASEDQNQQGLQAIDDKYSGLPARVEKLEAAVFPPKRQRRR